MSFYAEIVNRELSDSSSSADDEEYLANREWVKFMIREAKHKTKNNIHFSSHKDSNTVLEKTSRWLKREGFIVKWEVTTHPWRPYEWGTWCYETVCDVSWGA